MDLATMDDLIEWKLFKWKAAKEARAKGEKMQDQITIEMRFDFADPDKLPEVRKIACSMARTLVANVQLLGPTCKPECVVFTDNFMNPAEKIDIYADLIGKGKEELAEVAARDAIYDPNNTATVTEPAEEISQELLDAMKGGA